MRKIFASALLVVIALLAAPSLAADKPQEIDAYIHASMPYGSGSYQALFTTIYDADLWTDAPQWSWDTVFALSLHYDTDIDRKDLTEKSIERMNAIEALTKEQTQDYKAQLDKTFPNVKEGDEITALYLPQNGLFFYHNGASIGAIDDSAFARRFLSIWLSEKTAAPRLRRQLLALSAHQQEE